jgi:nucleotide-binding universal stress UspA family protein
MRFTKILCPTDFSPGSQPAVGAAVQLANATNAELVLAHAWYLTSPLAGGEYVFPPQVTQQLVDDSQRALDDAVRGAGTAGATRVSGRLLAGAPWAQIVGLLEAEPFDLCVIGTHGRTGLSRILLGSVAENVVRHAPCSVLTVRPTGVGPAFEHVLVPTDFSESSDQALGIAAEMVRPGGAITLLHVLELPVSYRGEVPIPELARDLDKHAVEALEKRAKRLGAKLGGRVLTRSRIGYPGAQTLAVLDDDRTIDLVVMGSHGRTGLRRVLLGSVAEKVVRNARCSVLVARKRS